MSQDEWTNQKNLTHRCLEPIFMVGGICVAHPDNTVDLNGLEMKNVFWKELLIISLSIVIINTCLVEEDNAINFCSLSLSDERSKMNETFYLGEVWKWSGR